MSGPLAIVAAAVAFVLTTASAFAQTTPGFIFERSTIAPVSPLDPNNNGWCSKTTSGFVTSDVTESELPFITLPQFMAEPTGDGASGTTGGCTDLIQGAAAPSMLVLYDRGSDNLPDTADDRLMFRMRIGSRITGAYGFSFLLDTDGRFGTAAPTADPNAVPGNPGFEAEILLATGGTDRGVNLLRVDGTATPTVCVQYEEARNTQKAYALTATSGDRDVFVDSFVNLSDLKTCYGITTATRIRLIAATNTSPSTSLGGGASEIGGVPDNDPRYGDNDTAFIEAMAAIPSAPIGDLGPGGGFDTTPPNTTLLSAPPATSPSSSGTFTFSADEAGATFDCSLDGRTYSACTTPLAVTGLTEGVHFFAVRARDVAGNADKTPATHTWTVDTAAPAPPVIIDPPTGAVVAPITLRFRGTAEPGSTVTLLIDGVSAGTVLADSAGQWFFIPTTPPANGEHVAVAKAADAAGNSSGTSQPVRFTVDPRVLDTAILSAPPSFLASTTANFSFLASQNNATFECSLDGASFSACANPTSFAGLSESTHTLAVRARTSSEVDASPATWMWTVDVTAPAAPVITSPVAGQSVGTTTPVITGTAEVRSTVTVLIDGVEVGTATTDVWGRWSFPCSSLSTGPHTVAARAADRAGNRSPLTAAISFTVDPNALDTFILSGPPPFTTLTTATLDCAANPADSTFECSLDGAAWAACADPVKLTGLLEGPHTLNVRARTAAGIVDATPALWRWTVDFTVPAAPVITRPTAGGTAPPFPLITGTADALGTVTVTLDGVVVGKAAVDAAGNWSFSPATALAAGAHTVSARTTDAAGNTGPSSATVPFTVDLTPPDTWVVSGPPATTNATFATFDFGASETGSTFECSVDASSFAACVPPWSVSGLGEGSHSMAVRAVDPNGNVDPSPATWSWFIDRTPPSAATITSPVAGSTVGATPVIAGTAEPGNTVAVAIDGTSIGTATASGSGEWSLAVSNALADGAHTASAVAHDPAGNPAAPAIRPFIVDATPPDTSVASGPAATTNSTSAAFTFQSNDPSATFECSLGAAAFAPCTASTTLTGVTEGPQTLRVRARDAVGNLDPTPATWSWLVDLTAPAAPLIQVPAAGAVVGATPLFSGTAEPGSVVTLRVDGTPVGTALVDPSGNWSLTPASSLANGMHNATATATDVAGNTSPPSAAVAFLSDGTPPETTIESGPQNPTNVTTATFQLSSNEAGSTFECKLDTGAFGPCTPTTTFPGLLEGGHTVTVRARDVAGNADPTPASWSWMIDVTAPETTISSGPAALTNATTATLGFTSSEAGGSFECSLDGAAFATCSAPADLSGLADGTHTFRVRARDAAGNVDPTPASHTWAVDATAPDTTLTSGPAPRTNATSATFALASNESGVTWECALDGGPFLACASSTAFAGLAERSHTFEARARDAAGNADPTPATWTWTVDTTAPAAPAFLTPADGSAVATATPAFTGTAEPGSTVTLSIDGVAAATLVANASGGWAWTPSASLAQGAHTASATATDAAGNVSASAMVIVHVDTIPPDTSIVASPAALSRSAQADFDFASNETGVTFECRLDTGAFAACSDPLRLSSLDDGPHTLEVRARDAAGNVDVSPALFAWTVDTLAPMAATITAPAPGAFVATSTPAMTGRAEAGSTVTLTIDGTEVTVLADASGNWSHTPAALADGPHTLVARATDSAGNPGPASPTVSFTVDTLAPETAIASGPVNPSKSADADFDLASNETGVVYECRVDAGTFAPCSDPAHFAALADGSHTLEVRARDAAGNADATPATFTWTVDTVAPVAPAITAPASGAAVATATPTLTGTAEAGSTVTVTLDGNGATVQADANGAWAFTPATLADGPHTVTARATDAAGNPGPASPAVTFTVDTAAPDTTIVTGPVDPSSSADADFDLASNETGVTFECRLDAGTFAPCSDPAHFAALGDGSHTLEVRARDAAGNVDPTPATFTWTVDTGMPAAPTVDAPASGASLPTGTPTISGKAEPGSTVAVTLDDVEAGTCSADANGNWTFTPATALVDGPHTVSARATDSAGNPSPASATVPFTVDTVAPDTSIVSSPKSLANATTADFDFASNETGVTYECSLDGATYAPCGDPAHFTSLAEGSHTLAVRARDAAGNADASPATFAWEIDVTAPTAPTIATPADNAALDTGLPTFTGTAEPGSTVTVTIDGTAHGTTLVDAAGLWTFTCVQPLADGPHAASATATDPAGNQGPASAAKPFTIDTGAPETTIASGPAALTNVKDADFEFESDELSVTYECSLDGAAFAPCADPTRIPALGDGPHTLDVRARDGAGNVDLTPAQHAWTVDTWAPQSPRITSPVDGSVVDTSTPTVTGIAAPGATVNVQIDGAPAATVDADENGKWSFDAAVLEDGAHTASATATDAAGNTSVPSNTVAFRVRTGALPAPTIESPADGAALATATPAISGQGRVGTTVQVRVDEVAIGTAQVDATGHWTLAPAAPLADGRRVLTAVAIDAEDRLSLPSAPVTILVDTRAPDTAIAAPTVDVLAERTQLDFAADEPDCTFECSVDGAEFGPCASPLDLATLAGNHTLEVRARDALGNVDATPARIEWPVPLAGEALRGSGCGCSSSSDPSPLFALGLFGLLALGRRRRAAAGVAAAAVLVSSSAFAQTTKGSELEFERLMLNPSATRSLVFGLGDLLPAGDFRIGLAGHYEHEPLVYYRNSVERGALVSGRTTAHVLAAWAPISRLELDLQVPVILHQAGDDLTAYGFSKPSTMGLGTPMVRARYGLLSVASGSPLDLSTEVGLRAPVGSAAAFGSDGGFGLDLRAGASRRFGLFDAGAQIGGLFRQAGPMAGRAPGSELFANGNVFDVGGTLAYGGDGPRAEIDAWMSIPASDLPVSAELLAGGRLPLGSFDVFALAGPGFGQYPGTPVFRAVAGVAYNHHAVAAPPPAKPVPPPGPCDPGQKHTPEQCPNLDDDGDGVANAKDVCVLVAGLEKFRGCPDRDGDGVADAEDSCPDEAGFIERQGCLDRDSDGDGLADAEDACPRERGELDLKGCPTRDSDEDGVADAQDACPAEKGEASLKGCPKRDADEDGLADADDACPTEKGEARLKGCPARDGDADGITDDADRCPTVVGIADLFGCPAADTDGDTVADHVDNCIREKGPPRNQGCPLKKKQLVTITREKLVIADKVYFATGKATIQSRSFPMLGQVADVLNQHPEIPRVLVEGHTDDRGSAELNRKLSQARAESVRTFLVKKGVDPSRLDAKGFGPDRPADTNANARGRENNRRVEFMIVQASPEVVSAVVQDDGSHDKDGQVDPAPLAVPAKAQPEDRTDANPARAEPKSETAPSTTPATPLVLPEGAGKIEPKPVAMPEAAATRTGCNEEVIGRHLTSRSKAIQGCYERELKGGKSIRGKLTLLLTIGKSGRVTDLAIDEDTLKSPAVVRCVRNTIRLWVFPTDGEECQVTYPFLFAPSY